MESGIEKKFVITTDDYVDVPPTNREYAYVAGAEDYT